MAVKAADPIMARNMVRRPPIRDVRAPPSQDPMIAKAADNARARAIFGTGMWRIARIRVRKMVTNPPTLLTSIPADKILIGDGMLR
jgi:hypothetical protein